jgi:AcrR family transcriptional regulator
MGRKAGVTADQTKAELLAAAARVFALKGYDGASIADITNEAGLSSGSIYAHYKSKAELFVAVLEAHGKRQYSKLIGADPVNDVVDLVTVAGSNFDRRRSSDVALVLEAIVAARRDPEVAELVGSWCMSHEAERAALFHQAQTAGVLDESIQPETISRFATMVALGSFLTAALDVQAVDHEDWTRLITRVVDGFRVAAPKPTRRS